jgi:hypothetical protein
MNSWRKQAITLTIPQIGRLLPITCAMGMLRKLSGITGQWLNPEAQRKATQITVNT